MLLIKQIALCKAPEHYSLTQRQSNVGESHVGTERAFWQQIEANDMFDTSYCVMENDIIDC